MNPTTQTAETTLVKGLSLSDTIMLLVGGEDALTGLQTITIIAALPFVLVMIAMAVALVKDLRHDPKMVRRQYASEAVDAADLGDEDAELLVGDAQDHDLAWYAPQELAFLLELL